MDDTNQKLQIPEEIKAYIEGILKDANMTTLTPEMHEEMVNELFARLDSYMTSVIVDNMPEENLEEFIKMNEEKKPREEIEKFLQEKVPNVQDKLTNAFADFREMYLRNVTVARNAPAENADAPVANTAAQPEEPKQEGGNN